MKTDEYGIPEIRCRTVNGLLRQLDESHKRWAGSTWIYRGQLDGSLPLNPSAMRESFRQKYLCQFFGSRSDAEQIVRSKDESVEVDEQSRWFQVVQQVTVELTLVQTFADLADKSGLSLPFERVERLDMFGDLVRRVELQSEMKKNPSLVALRTNPNSVFTALAQHYGIPTRLLDFTFRPLVAAYFASSFEGNPSEAPERMAVWAIDIARLYETSLEIVTHRRSQIGFLQAQDSLFVYDTNANLKFEESGYWQSFETELHKIRRSKAVYKITLPFRMRKELSHALRKKGVTRSSLMPSYESVASDIKEDPLLWSKYVSFWNQEKVK